MQPVPMHVGESTGAVLIESAPARQPRQQVPENRYSRLFPLGLVSALTLIAVFIHGYHPYAEDGGIYLPGIFKLLDPALYPAWTGFVTAQSRFSLFPALAAAITRVSGLNVMTCVLAIYMAGIWATLYGAWHLLVRFCRSREARIAGVAVLALCLTIPIAGTSLILLDPYVTARSISTPCSVLALVGALDLIVDMKQNGRVRLQSAALCAVSLLIAALMHPLMAAYAAGSIALLACCSITNTRLKMIALGSVTVLSGAVAAVVNRFAPQQPGDYSTVVQTRYYWFLSHWQWYEIAGLIAPLVLLFALTRYKGFNESARWLAQMCVSVGIIGLMVSLLFARESGLSYFVAMLQPLRVFLIVYVVMLLLTAALLAETFLRQNPLRWTVTLLPLGALMCFVQLQTYPHSLHLEFPWTSPHNDWERGFSWIRNNTPKNAIFALDAKYILTAGEDAQNFRAIAQRSSPPDYQKDGGLAAIEPSLTSGWMTGQAIQDNLGNSTDAERRVRFATAGIQWLVLPVNSVTGFACPYQNTSMKVCRVPER